MPVENAEYQRISEAKAFKALEPREKVRLIDLRQHKGPNVREVAAGNIGGFVVSRVGGRPVGTALLTVSSNNPSSQSRALKKTRLPAANEMYCSTRYLHCFANTLIGNLPILKLGQISLNNILRRRWKWSPISLEPETSP